jgi:hypothetical protein
MARRAATTPRLHRRVEIIIIIENTTPPAG